MMLDYANTREDVIGVFEGYSDEPITTAEGVVRTRRPLVKSYMLETVPPEHQYPQLSELFGRVGHRLIAVDPSMFKVVDDKTQVFVGVVEQLRERYPVYYTMEKSEDANPLVKRLVESNPQLDHLWISGQVFDELFKVVLRTTPNHRLGSLVFQHTSVFEQEEPDCPLLDDEVEELQPSGDWDEDDKVIERRATKFSMVERLETLRDKLPEMRKIHKPLWAISQMRFPAIGHSGGHDIFQNGKVTNRSRSFAEHRQRVEFVLDMYGRLTSQTEEAAWQGIEKTTIRTAGETKLLVGAPVVLKFSEPLPKNVFDTFIQATFGREINRFRLWGDPIRLGPTKVHVYGVDRHIWQPIFLEITDKQITVIVPRGTCGNSVHRLITNVQQYLDPAVIAWVGDRLYSDLVRNQFAKEEGAANDGSTRRTARR